MKEPISAADKTLIDEMISRARTAMSEVEGYSQSQLDRLCQSIGWHSSNEAAFTQLAQAGVDESGIGDRDGRPGKRFKIHGVLRDAFSASLHRYPPSFCNAVIILS